MKSKDILILGIVALIAVTILMPGMMEKVRSATVDLMQPASQSGYVAPAVRRDTDPGMALAGGIVFLLILAILSAPLKGKG